MTTPAGIEVFTDQGAGTGSSLTTGATSLTVNATTAFPVASSSVIPNTFFRIIDPAAPTEIMLVTVAPGGTGSGQAWTIVRGASPVTHASNWNIQQVVGANTLQNLKQATTAATSAVTLANSTTETVIASYLPLSYEITPGASFEIIAYGQYGKIQGGALHTMQFTIYWGGSGSVGGAFTSTGSTMLAQIITGTNAPAFLTTIAAAGNGFDVNGTLMLNSTTTASCNMNLWYNNAAALTTTVSTAVTNNTNASHQSTTTPITISGSGPIILTAKFSQADPAYTLTALAPLIYRSA